MKTSTKLLYLALSLLLALSLVACGPTAQPTLSPAQRTYETLVVGFSQTGVESTWRTAETNSIKETAQQLGVQLRFADAQQKQENQIKAIRSFIYQRVDVIAVAPIVESGWEAIFQEAKAAGIPIVLVDRHAAVSDDLFATFIGSDYVLEGENACQELATLLGGRGNVVELEGPAGAGPTDDRKKGFADCIAKSYPNIKILASQSGDSSLAKGQEAMAALLKTYGNQINGLYAHSDDMGLGAIQAIEAYGKKPGVDIKIVSIDGVRGAFEAMVAGKLNVTVECNPLLGPQLFEAALKLVQGSTVEKWVKASEGVFRQDTAATELPNRKY